MKHGRIYHREYGKEQEYITFGLFKIHLSFLHLVFSGPELFNGAFSAFATMSGLATLADTLSGEVERLLSRSKFHFERSVRLWQ